jgi:hypothetical protein
MSVAHEVQRSQPIRLVLPPARQTNVITVGMPTRSTRLVKAQKRISPKMIPTSGLLDALLRFLTKELAFRTPLSVPTLKMKAPCTGCESAEMTRQATTYVP